MVVSSNHHPSKYQEDSSEETYEPNSSQHCIIVIISTLVGVLLLGVTLPILICFFCCDKGDSSGNDGNAAGNSAAGNGNAGNAGNANGASENAGNANGGSGNVAQPVPSPPDVVQPIPPPLPAIPRPPVPSQQAWPDKQLFLKLVSAVESELRRRETAEDKGKWMMFSKGMSPSRLTTEMVGSQEFRFRNDDDELVMKWPDGYAQHYIGEWNVFPTERFFESIQEIGKKMGSSIAMDESEINKIGAPPKFAVPSTFGEAEGYWSNLTSKGHGEEEKAAVIARTKNLYLPISSPNLIWADKEKFLALVKKQQELAMKENRSVQYKGYADSRLVQDLHLGSAEYLTKHKETMSKSGFGGEVSGWPQQYASHYLKEWNVMPTKRFFDYIISISGGEAVKVNGPPEFMPPSPFGGKEGYWGKAHFPEQVDA